MQFLKYLRKLASPRQIHTQTSGHAECWCAIKKDCFTENSQVASFLSRFPAHHFIPNNGSCFQNNVAATLGELCPTFTWAQNFKILRIKHVPKTSMRFPRTDDATSTTRSYIYCTHPLYDILIVWIYVHGCTMDVQHQIYLGHTLPDIRRMSAWGWTPYLMNLKQQLSRNLKATRDLDIL